jgi:ribosomal protein S18 acetylase RimI-like enzyme
LSAFDADGLVIRPFSDGEDGAVAALWDRCGLTVSYNDPATDIAFCRASETSEMFVAEANSQLIGTVMCGHDGHRGWLYYVAVDPDLQRGGIGRRLVRHGEAWLKAAGVPKINLMIRHTNQPVRDFYASLGYADTPRHVMGKFLADETITPATPVKIETTITYLEMTARPERLPAVTPAKGTTLLRAQQPPVSFYRYLYNTVGGPWLWYERRAMDDETLIGHIHDPDVEIYVLYHQGSPAGYVELDRRVRGEVELAYAGLVPDTIGKGLGLAEIAWSGDPERYWVHTCTLDHPRALSMYQRVGFSPYKQEGVEVDDPRLSGLFPANWPLPPGARLVQSDGELSAG